MNLENLFQSSSKKGNKRLTTAATHTDEAIPKANQVAASSSQALKTLPAEAGSSCSKYTGEFGAACWHHFKSFLHNEWDFINNGNLEKMLERSVAHGLSKVIGQREAMTKEWNDSKAEVTGLTKEAEEVKRTHKADLEAAKNEAKDKTKACQKLQEEYQKL
uniref:Uncharacterized protein n=1 Tax=Cannabis sativa TaxID=3483 RepID=A0A803QNR8_CANSA